MVEVGAIPSIARSKLRVNFRTLMWLFKIQMWLFLMGLIRKFKFLR